MKPANCGRETTTPRKRESRTTKAAQPPQRLAQPRHFRYLRRVRGAARSSVPVRIVVLLCAGLGGVGCAPKSKTPAEAYARFSQAVTARDGGALYDALDQSTRWAWMTVQTWHREAYDIVISNYPQGPERERELRRFEKGATASSARELFKAEMATTMLPLLAPLVVAGTPTIETVPPGDVAEVVLPAGGRVRFARGEKGGWGFNGFAPDAESRKMRAYHDLEQVRANAADYERAAARGAR
jgi:hypothetical protein